MSHEKIDDREGFELAFHYFIEALRVLSHDVEMQCEEMGNYNVPWETRHDVSDGGSALLHLPENYLTKVQNESVAKLVFALNNLPTEAAAPPNMLTTNHLGSIAAMNHPAWGPLRRDAARLLQLLEPAIRQNEAYFAARS